MDVALQVEELISKPILKEVKDQALLGLWTCRVVLHQRKKKKYLPTGLRNGGFCRLTSAGMPNTRVLFVSLQYPGVDLLVVRMFF